MQNQDTNVEKREQLRFHRGMKAIYAREVTPGERATIERGLRSSSALTVRRCQILLMSSEEGHKAAQIAKRLRCSDQTVRRTIHAFEEEGVASLEAQSRARQDDQRAFDYRGRERLTDPCIRN